MTAEPGRIRGGYCEYPGVTPPGNPDWWTRDTNQRPPALNTAQRPQAPIPTRQPADPITPVDEPTREPAESGMVRHWITERTAATAPAAKADEPRRWWHYLTARRR